MIKDKSRRQYRFLATALPIGFPMAVGTVGSAGRSFLPRHGRACPRGYQDRAADEEGFGARPVAPPSWPGVSRPSALRRRGVNGRDYRPAMTIGRRPCSATPLALITMRYGETIQIGRASCRERV